MKLIAKNTINLGGGKSAAPGDEFEANDSDGKALIDAGAAEKKTRTVEDDGKEAAPAKAEATGTVQVAKAGPAVRRA